MRGQPMNGCILLQHMLVVFGVNGMRGVGWQSLLNTKSDLVWLIVSFLDVDSTIENEVIREIETMQSTKLSTKKYALQVATRELEIVLGGEKCVVVSSNEFFHEFGRTERWHSRPVKWWVKTGRDFCKGCHGSSGSLDARMMGIISSQGRSNLICQNVFCLSSDHCFGERRRQDLCEMGVGGICGGAVTRQNHCWLSTTWWLGCWSCDKWSYCGHAIHAILKNGEWQEGKNVCM